MVKRKVRHRDPQILPQKACLFLANNKLSNRHLDFFFGISRHIQRQCKQKRKLHENLRLLMAVLHRRMHLLGGSGQPCRKALVSIFSLRALSPGRLFEARLEFSLMLQLEVDILLVNKTLSR